MNNAQWLLYNIGGTAELVAGAGGHYWSDHQTQKREPSRPMTGRGNYGRNVMAHFDMKRMDAKKAVQELKLAA